MWRTVCTTNASASRTAKCVTPSQALSSPFTLAQAHGLTLVLGCCNLNCHICSRQLLAMLHTLSHPLTPSYTSHHVCTFHPLRPHSRASRIHPVSAARTSNISRQVHTADEITLAAECGASLFCVNERDRATGQLVRGQVRATRLTPLRTLHYRQL